jgi:hypothetical protein
MRRYCCDRCSKDFKLPRGQPVAIDGKFFDLCSQCVAAVVRFITTAPTPTQVQPAAE